MLESLKKLNWFFKKRKKDYIIGVSILMLTNVIVVTTPLVIGKAIDSIVSGKITYRLLMIYTIMLSALLISEYVLGYLWQYEIFKNAVLIEKELVSKIMRKFLKMKSPFYEKYNTGDLMARSSSDIKEIQELTGFGVLAISDGIGFSFAILISMCVFVSWKLTIASILPFPILALLINFLGKYLHQSYMEYQSEFSNMNDKVLEYVSGVRVVRAYVMENRTGESFSQTTEKTRNKMIKSGFFSDAVMPLAIVFMTISNAIAIAYGTMLIMDGQITVGLLISFNIYLNFLSWPMFAIGEFMNIAQRGTSSINRIDEIMQESNAYDEIQKTPLKGDIDKILFENYSFSYPSSSSKNLKNINLEIKNGQTIGIVGKTGSGKTTLVKQLLKQYEMGLGNLCINDIMIKNIQDKDLMKKIGYVSQDNILFSKSIRENIFFALEDNFKDEEKLLNSIRLSDFEKDIFSLPNGLDTLVGERGVAVSGGQKQRISIARALIKDPQLLILDDSLSAVDSKTEYKIIENIRKNRKNKTTIIVTHRLSATQHADNIIVLENGEIVESGTHDELIKKGGWYMQQYNTQRLEDKENGEY